MLRRCTTLRLLRIQQKPQVLTICTVLAGLLVRKVFGLIQMLSGGRFDIAALRDITITTQQEIQGHAGVKQHFEAPLTWVGSEDENVLLLLSELHQQVIDLCGVLDDHNSS